jgi:hypothetical protein
MSLIDSPDGSPAWVCDPVEWAIYPERHEALQQWAKTSPEGKLLKAIFGEDPDQ